ncbi:thiamine phosphate synthase [Emticicia sp. BO119]|uniref:thiamine phosphate synthase n=1 Tax=Emticicia sp. BO119 TaxID=2757768 RepID=UPI0015F030AE|nr:thiamine phosphate synthase [Emticicia sp. BO119]MBA4849321.1 thiamine phosphate synthase [Emticicia sp. BO119]
MKKHPLFPYQLYLVISEAACQGRDFLKVAEQAIAGGVEIIQLREKKMSTTVFIERALQLKEVTDRYNVPLIINDNVEVAKAIQAFGVHVGNNDSSPVEIRLRWGDELQIGYSIEYLSQMDTELTETANHLGISPVFSTKTKTDTITEWGLDGISLIRSISDKPLIAIGSMNKANANEVMRAGADCIAVVSAICSAGNPEKAAYELRNEITK